jgi:hypothetical protein
LGKRTVKALLPDAAAFRCLPLVGLAQLGVTADAAGCANAAIERELLEKAAR